MSGSPIAERLRSFVRFAIDKLDAATESLLDEDEEDNYQELITFTSGLSRHLKNTGASAPAELKAAIAGIMAPVWDLKTEQPGENLREGGVAELRKVLQDGLLGEGGPLAAGEPEPAPEPAEATETPVNPANLSGMGLQEAISHMWEVLDKANRVEWGEEGFTLDLQQKGRYGRDRCSQPLFTTVNLEHPFWSSATTKSFIALLDNYEREVGRREVITRAEKAEMSAFIDAICATDVIKFALKFLQQHGKDPRCRKLHSMSDFANLLYDLWLAPYRRRAANDSSGFEHVFVGEEKNGKITGLHNWVQYYLEEKAGNIDYLGWAGKQDSDYSDDVNLVTVKFKWDDDDSTEEIKPMSTILCGSTVEFEVAALTIAFLAGEQNGDNMLTLGSEDIKITCYAQRQRYGGPKIGTAFMEIV